MLLIDLLNHAGDPRLPTVIPLAVKPREAARMLGCGLTRLYELMANNELESFRDGASRKITTRSIVARIDRLAAAAAKSPEAA
jgi:excisionase family DNA binding protein